MKKIILYIGILFHIISCQQDYNVTPLPDDERVPVTFAMTLPGDITCDTEIVPMSRATGDTVMAAVANMYRVVVSKKIGDNWYIDTVVNPLLDKATSLFRQVPVYRHSAWEPLQLELRPGLYRVALFLNPGTLTWNPQVKSGAFVATDADLRAGQNILPAASVTIRNGKYTIFAEIFAGQAQFNVEKNTHLGTRAASPAVNVRVERKVSRFRYMLRVPTDKTEGFGGTQYWLNATMQAPPGQYFCEGLDVLGQHYRTDRDVIVLQCSSNEDVFYSELDGFYYQMPVEIPDYFPTAGPTHPTNFAPFILTDSDMECTFKLDIITGATPGSIFNGTASVPYTLRANGINGFAFERDPDIQPTFDGTHVYFGTRVLDGVDVRESFHPFYELNAVRTDILEQ